MGEDAVVTTRPPDESRPTPELRPVAYWPSRRAGEPDCGSFQGPGSRLRQFGALMTGLAFLPMGLFIAGWIAGERIAPAGLFGPALILLGGVATWRRGVRLDHPRTGIWTVDERGYPQTYISAKKPVELKGDRGVTYEAFRASIELRTSSTMPERAAGGPSTSKA